MKDLTHTALDATRRIRESRGYRGLDPRERSLLDANLSRIEAALDPGAGPGSDPYTTSLALGDAPGGSAGAGQSSQGAAPPPAPPAPPPPPGTAQIGRRAAEALEAVNFPGFVAGL